MHWALSIGISPLLANPQSILFVILLWITSMSLCPSISQSVSQSISQVKLLKTFKIGCVNSYMAGSRYCDSNTCFSCCRTTWKRVLVVVTGKHFHCIFTSRKFVTLSHQHLLTKGMAYMSDAHEGLPWTVLVGFLLPDVESSIMKVMSVCIFVRLSYFSHFSKKMFRDCKYHLV